MRDLRKVIRMAGVALLMGAFICVFAGELVAGGEQERSAGTEVSSRGEGSVFDPPPPPGPPNPGNQDGDPDDYDRPIPLTVWASLIVQVIWH